MKRLLFLLCSWRAQCFLGSKTTAYWDLYQEFGRHVLQVSEVYNRTTVTVRNSIAKIEAKLTEILQDVICPIWTPIQVRLACKVSQHPKCLSVYVK